MEFDCDGKSKNFENLNISRSTNLILNVPRYLTITKFKYITNKLFSDIVTHLLLYSLKFSEKRTNSLH